VPKKVLISVIDDDRSFRNAIKRLMKSLGYTVEAFASAADFLASADVLNTSCLIADVLT
jgi:FixJ family two-component response regulator